MNYELSTELSQSPVKISRMNGKDYEVTFHSTKAPSSTSWQKKDYFEIVFIHQGNAIYFVEDMSYDLFPGDVLMLPPNVPIRIEFRNVPIYKRIQLRMSRAFMDKIDPDNSLREIFTRKASSGKPNHLLRENNYRIVMMAETLFHEVMSGKTFTNRMASLQIERILIMIYRQMNLEYSAGDDTNKIVVAAAEYINNNLDKDLSLKILADHLFVSKFYLSRLFREEMGVSTHEYITQRRMITARKLINEGLPFHLIYRKCGFSNYSTFYRVFERYFGCCPSDFVDFESRHGESEYEME